MLLALLKKFSVPIRGLFNLTSAFCGNITKEDDMFSVPIRGLFNLTRKSQSQQGK